MYSKLLEYIDEKSIENDSEKCLCRINTTLKKSQYLTSDDLKTGYFKYIEQWSKQKTSSSNLLTDKENHMQILNALNVIYLDGDWTFSDNFPTPEYSKASQDLMNLYCTTWCEVLEQHGYDTYYDFKFIPHTWGKRKGGFHVFIYLDKNISKELRENFYKEVYERIKISNEYYTHSDMFDFGNKENKNETMASYSFFAKVFDKGPLVSCSVLLPFAEKKGATRRYELVQNSFFDSEKQDYFILPIRHSEFSIDDMLEDVENDDDIEKYFDNEPDDLDKEIDELLRINESQNNSFTKLGLVGRITADFMNSLVYLSKQHIFWKILADHDKRLKYVLTPLIRFVSANYFIEHRGKKPVEKEFIEQITRMLLPLLSMSVLIMNDRNTERDTFKSCYQHVKGYYCKYTQAKQALFTDDNEVFWDEYVRMTAKEKKNLEFTKKCHLSHIQKILTKFYGSWFDFITKIILNGMTDEIRPFTRKVMLQDDPREGVIFDDVVPEQVSVSSNTDIEPSFYIETLQLWTRMFIIVEYYNLGTLPETIRSIITAFTRYFIWSSKNGKNNKIYIYNIRQTVQLCSYPYNQWIIDANEGDLLKGWITSLYLQIVKPNILRNVMVTALKPLLDNIRMVLGDEVKLNIDGIKPISNFDKDTKTLFDNILSAYGQEHYDPPKEIDAVSSNWFPMRNGLLEFLSNGDVKMHYDNRRWYMNTYSNILWSENYDESCEEFVKVKTMWQQIFPIQEERDYCLKIFSSALNGTILKDMLLIQYGKGGDGKTVSNTALIGMLGSNNLTSGTTIQEFGKTYILQLPTGMATTMKTETILTSNKGSHDSGGIVMLMNKRFCTVQEPDPNVSNGKLNCARIKEILSGASITAREIFKSAEQFTPNAILTLQTNILLAYTEDTDAIRRRVAVIPYRSKFENRNAKGRFESLEYVFDQDPNISSSLINNPKYWQALFRILLPLAQDLIRSGIKALSDIPRPRSVDKETNDSFSNSNGIVGWFAKNIVKTPGKVLSVPSVIAKIIEANSISKSEKNGAILEQTSKRGMTKEISEQITATYLGAIYRVQDKYYIDNNTRLENNLDDIQINDWADENMEELFRAYNESTDDEERNMLSRQMKSLLIKEYFTEFAVNNMEASNMPLREDLFILGFGFRS